MAYNVGRGATGTAGGALGGAAIGAGLGSFFPGIGTAIGAGIGAGGGALSGMLSGIGGKESGFEQAQRFTPGQTSSMEQLLQLAMQNINPEAIEQRARSQFSQQTVPGLAERFTSLGGGKIGSPAFAQQLGGAGAQLEEGLAAQRQNMLLPLLQLGLQPQFDTVYRQREPGFGENLLLALLGAGGQAGGMALQGHIQNQGLKNLLALKGK